MPVCPKCKNESARRVNGRCPKCLTPVELVNGKWQVKGAAEKVIAAFERGTGFRLNRKSAIYRQELKAAWKFVEYDPDLDFVCKVVEEAAKQYAGRSLRFFTPAFLRVYDQMDRERKAAEKQRQLEQKNKQLIIDNIPDVW